jgi:hypothetical protein
MNPSSLSPKTKSCNIPRVGCGVNRNRNKVSVEVVLENSGDRVSGADRGRIVTRISRDLCEGDEIVGHGQ